MFNTLQIWELNVKLLIKIFVFIPIKNQCKLPIVHINYISSGWSWRHFKNITYCPGHVPGQLWVSTSGDSGDSGDSEDSGSISLRIWSIMSLGSAFMSSLAGSIACSSGNAFRVPMQCSIIWSSYEGGDGGPPSTLWLIRRNTAKVANARRPIMLPETCKLG